MKSDNAAMILFSVASLGSIVTPAEVFFQPAIERDEQVATSHLFDLEL